MRVQDTALYLKAEASGNKALAQKLRVMLKEPEEKTEVDSEGEIRYNKKGLYKQIPRREYAIISSRIMEDNSRYMTRDEELPRYGKARSDKYFYVYENFAPGNFGVLKQIVISDENRGYIASVEAKIGENNDEQTIGSTREFNRVLEILKNNARRNRGNNAHDSTGRANRDDGRISFGESTSNGIGDSKKGGRNNGRIIRESSSKVTDPDRLIKLIMVTPE